MYSFAFLGLALAMPPVQHPAQHPASSVPRVPLPVTTPTETNRSLPTLMWSDFDDDGHSDLLAIRAGALHLFRSTSGSGLVDCTDEFGLSGLEPMAAASFIDFDRDGLLDLFLVSAAGEGLLLRNESGAAFVDATTVSGIAAGGPILKAEWNDIDGDALPDLVLWTPTEVQLNRNLGGTFDVQRLDLAAVGGPLGSGGSARTGGLPSLLGGLSNSGSRPGAARRNGGAEGPPAEDHDSGGAGQQQLAGPGYTTTAAGLPPRSAEMSIPSNCARFLVDMATQMCLSASSVPALGQLYPLSAELNVEAATGRVGMGTVNPGAKLHVVPSGTDFAMRAEGAILVGAGSPGVLMDVDAKGAGRMYVLTSKGGTMMQILAEEVPGNGPQLDFYAFDGTGTFTLDAEQGSEGAAMHLRTAGGTTTLIHDAQASTRGAYSRYLMADGTRTVEITAEEVAGDGGQISIENAAGIPTIYLDGDTGRSAGQLSLHTSTGALAVKLDAEHFTGEGSTLEMFNSTGARTVLLDAEESGGNGAALYLFHKNGLPTITNDADRSDLGGSTIYRMASGINTLELEAEEVAGDGGQITVGNALGTSTIFIDGDTPHSSGQIAMYNAAGVQTVRIDSEEVAGNGAQILLRKADGSIGMILDAEQGGVAKITTEVLEITGGADLVESFETGGVECEPGSVVVIDTLRAGHLTLSSVAYDSRVAGVVSGAGDVRPGLHLGQAGVTSGDTQVALTGRVYVRCSDENGPVHPGDLLTTSSTPGLAMRAADIERSFGAVLGKALGSLEGSSGLVLTLVNLQ